MKLALGLQTAYRHRKKQPGNHTYTAVCFVLLLHIGFEKVVAVFSSGRAWRSVAGPLA